jgi:hypothetical protein
VSTKEYGCFFCDSKSTDSSGTCNNCGKPIDISKELLEIEIDAYQVKEVLGRGFYGWTLKVEDRYQPFAVKIIPRDRIKRGPLEDKEARALAACSPHRNIARFWRQIETKILILSVNIEVICLVFDYVDQAEPLSKFLANNDVILKKGDVTEILAGISSGLARLHSKNLWHDDLHDDNILIRYVQPDENLQERFEAKLIDFGSTKPLKLGEPENAERSDYLYLGKHIYNLVAKFEFGNQRLLTPVDRNFASRLRHLGHRLSDKDVSRRNLQPSDLQKEIRNILDESSTGYNFPSFDEMRKQTGISLSDPLGNTNALSLKPQDIALLFVDALKWTPRLEKSEPVFIIGPRGCGKTMLLRWLSITSQARPSKNEKTREQVAKRLNSNKHIGFLVNGAELRTPFLRSAYKKLEVSDWTAPLA